MDVHSASSGFVSATPAGFRMNGQPFRVAGANSYYLPYAGGEGAEAVFRLASRMGLNTLRTWAFLDCGAAAPGEAPVNAKNGVFFQYWNEALGRPDYNDGPDGLQRLDHVIALAERWNIRLILPLANYWPDFGGVDQYLQWFGLTGRAQFYLHPETRQAYRNYLEHIVLRVNTQTGREYREEPSILAWELMNEPRCVDTDGSWLPGGIDTLAAWVDEMSAHLKRLDPGHLAGAGDEGYFRKSWSWGQPLYNGRFGVDSERLLALPGIDFGVCHLYPNYAANEDAAAFGVRWIQEHLDAGRRAGKPVVVEEFGVKTADEAARNSIFGTWLDAVDAGNGAGAAVWMIASTVDGASLYPDYDGYTVYSAESVPALTAFARSGSV